MTTIESNDSHKLPAENLTAKTTEFPSGQLDGLVMFFLNSFRNLRYKFKLHYAEYHIVYEAVLIVSVASFFLSAVGTYVLLKPPQWLR
jgi:hypothetical protein